MRKDRIDKIKQLAGNPAFVPGIHNYCDRWCQRCPMTSRCSVFAMEHVDIEADGGGTAEDFWNNLTEILATASEMLHDWAEAAGLDLTEIDADDVERRSGDDHILVISARKYSNEVSDWFDSRALMPADVRDIQKDGAHIHPLPASKKTATAGDFIDIIQWYHTLIVAKLHRAVMPDPLESIEGMDIPRDADGSAKVALISIDRSLAAWVGLIEAFPAAKEEVQGFISHLERLRRAVQFSFPNARAFVRPGFDDNSMAEAPFVDQHGKA